MVRVPEDYLLLTADRLEKDDVGGTEPSGVCLIGKLNSISSCAISITR